jgi:ubiquinone biosynthesis protein Coq4
MDKLETFFIKTVAAAQQQAQTTSGAVSTTKIGDFLTRQTTAEDILDKLVSAPVSKESLPESPTTEKVVPVESLTPEPDEQLLSKLTGSAEPSQPEPVVRDEKVTTQPVESEAAQAEQVNKSILEKLTGRSRPQGEDEEQTDKSQAGDVGDA